MFESGNIQGRPTPELYQVSSLSTRTWNLSSAAFSTGIESADYFKVTHQGKDTTPEPVELSVSLESAVYFAPISNSSAAPVESAQHNTSLSAANYVSTILEGAEQEEPASLEAQVSEANYEQVISNSTGAPVEESTFNTSLIVANYESA